MWTAAITSWIDARRRPPPSRRSGPHPGAADFSQAGELKPHSSLALLGSHSNVQIMGRFASEHFNMIGAVALAIRCLARASAATINARRAYRNVNHRVIIHSFNVSARI